MILACPMQCNDAVSSSRATANQCQRKAERAAGDRIFHNLLRRLDGSSSPVARSRSRAPGACRVGLSFVPQQPPQRVRAAATSTSSTTGSTGRYAREHETGPSPPRRLASTWRILVALPACLGCHGHAHGSTIVRHSPLIYLQANHPNELKSPRLGEQQPVTAQGAAGVRRQTGPAGRRSQWHGHTDAAQLHRLRRHRGGLAGRRCLNGGAWLRPAPRRARSKSTSPTSPPPGIRIFDTANWRGRVALLSAAEQN